MIKNPDKWIRKAVIQSMPTVNRPTIYDMRVPATGYPSKYIVLSTQTKVDNENNKCAGQWDCTILLDIVTRYSGTGNPGDRVAVNDLEELVIAAMNNFSIEGFSLFKIRLESSTSLDTLTDTLNVFRQLVRYRIVLNEIVEPLVARYGYLNEGEALTEAKILAGQSFGVGNNTSFTVPFNTVSFKVLWVALPDGQVAKQSVTDLSTNEVSPIGLTGIFNSSVNVGPYDAYISNFATVYSGLGLLFGN